MNLPTKSKKGMTLVEVLVGVALFGIVSVGGIWLMTEKKKEEINGNIQVLAAEMAEQFFKARRDVFATSFEDTSVAPNREITFTEFVPKRIVVPGAAPELQYYSSINIPTSGCFTSGDAKLNYPNGFAETIENVSVPESTEVSIKGEVNESSLSEEEKKLIRNCAAPIAGLAPDSDYPFHRMRVQVTRTATGVNGAPNIQTTTIIPPTNQQGIIGAALCIVPNNDVLVARTVATAYNGINFRLLFVVKDANNRLKLVRKETSFARPRLRVEGSIIPDAIGCDKSQN